MSRLLTQAEVDALLTSFNGSPKRAAAAVQTPFDLRAPVLLAGERLALVQTACERIALVFAEVVGGFLGAERPVRGAFTGLIQQPAPTLLSTLAPGEPLGLLEDRDGQLLGAVTIHPELALALVERLQGGGGRPRQAARPFSPVESKLFEEVLDKLIEQLDRSMIVGSIQCGGVESAPLAGRLARRGGALAAGQIRLTTPVGEAVCRLLMTPALANRVVAQTPVIRKGDAPSALLDAVDRIPVAVSWAITGATANVADLAHLVAGDVIQLELREHEPLGLRFNGALLARAVLRRDGDEQRLEICELAPEATDTSPG